MAFSISPSIKRSSSMTLLSYRIYDRTIAKSTLFSVLLNTIQMLMAEVIKKIETMFMRRPNQHHEPTISSIERNFLSRSS